MSTDLRLVPGTLSDNSCWTTPQALYNEMFEKGVAQLGDITGILIQDTAPVPEDRDKAWIRTTAPGGPPSFYLPFVWYNGAWVARHPSAPSGDEIRMWIGSTTDLETYDGGAAGVVGDASGPMWEVASDFAGRFPIGVGTIPDTTVAVTVDTNAGAGQVTLSSVNIPQHSHQIGVESSDITGAAEDGQLRDASGDVTYISTWNQTAVGVTRNWGGAASNGATTPFDNTPPSRGVYFIRRTSRIFYTA